MVWGDSRKSRGQREVWGTGGALGETGPAIQDSHVFLRLRWQ